MSRVENESRNLEKWPPCAIHFPFPISHRKCISHRLKQLISDPFWCRFLFLLRANPERTGPTKHRAPETPEPHPAGWVQCESHGHGERTSFTCSHKTGYEAKLFRFSFQSGFDYFGFQGHAAIMFSLIPLHRCWGHNFPVSILRKCFRNQVMCE